MGYTLGVRRCTLWRPVFSSVWQAELTWENTGLAPLYADWPIALELRAESGQTVWSGQIRAPLSDWGPGSHTIRLTLDDVGTLPPGLYSLWVGIVDPLTGQPGVALQMDVPRDAFLYCAASFSL